MRLRIRRRNPIASAIILFVLGTFLAITAIAIDPNNVTCDGQTMTDSDVCIHYRNGVETSRNSLEQERQSQQTGRIVATIIALLCFGGGTFFVVRFSKTRAALKSRAASIAPQGSYPQQPAGYPPQGDYPQQYGAHPPSQGNYPQQPAGYPPQGGYPQQYGAYPPSQGNYPQQPAGYPPQGGYPQHYGGVYPPPQGSYPQPEAYPPPPAPPYGD